MLLIRKVFYAFKHFLLISKFSLIKIKLSLRKVNYWYYSFYGLYKKVSYFYWFQAIKIITYKDKRYKQN